MPKDHSKNAKQTEAQRLPYPYLCGGTFFAQVLAHRESKSSINEFEVMCTLLSIFNREFNISRRNSERNSFKNRISEFKKCRINSPDKFGLNDNEKREIFNKNVESANFDILKKMQELIKSIFEIQDSVKDVDSLSDSQREKIKKLIKSLLVIINDDKEISDDEKFYIAHDGSCVTKKDLKNYILNGKEIYLDRFLLGVWHYVIMHRIKDNKKGEATYSKWYLSNDDTKYCSNKEYLGTHHKEIGDITFSLFCSDKENLEPDNNGSKNEADVKNYKSSVSEDVPICDENMASEGIEENLKNSTPNVSSIYSENSASEDTPINNINEVQDDTVYNDFATESNIIYNTANYQYNYDNKTQNNLFISQSTINTHNDNSTNINIHIINDNLGSSDIIKEFKDDYKEILQFCINTDFTFEHIPLTFFTELENLYEEKWKFKICEINDKFYREIAKTTLDKLNEFIYYIRPYLTLNEGYNVLIYNLREYGDPKTLEEFRKYVDETFRPELFRLYNSLFSV